jgi:hypothetical protein
MRIPFDEERYSFFVFSQPSLLFLVRNDSKYDISSFQYRKSVEIFVV